MEQLDILNIQGETVGITNKGCRLKDGEYYLGVHAYIYNRNGHFLLQQRALNKDFLPGGWDIHMGHVIAGETSMDGIHREIQEEIGLNIPAADIRFVERVIWEIHHHMIDIYFVQANIQIEDLILQSEEVISAKFVSRDEMIRLVENMYYRPALYREAVLNRINTL